MTDLATSPTNGTSTRQLKTSLVDTIGETLDQLSPEARASYLLIIDRFRDLPIGDVDAAVKGIARLYGKAGTDGAHDDLLAGAVKFHRSDLKR